MKNDINYPLMRELQEMGLLTEEATPQVAGPFRIKAECFTGDTSGATKALASTPLNIISIMTIATASGTNNTLAQLASPTNYTLSGGTITYHENYSTYQIMVIYSY